MFIYLDNAATTRVCPEAAQAALEVMTEGFGNPSSRYALGSAAAERLERDRAVVAAALGCLSEEVVFTSCGTEGDNWAIRAAVEHGRRKGKHIVTTAIEHAAVLEPIRALEREGYEVTWLRPDREGRISPQAVEDALRPDTVLVSMMLVNNELGTLLPVREAGEAIRRSGCPALLHTDAVQGFLKVPFTPAELGADLLTVSGHKVRAPKGVGALYIRKGLKLKPLLLGGGQERGLRPGTEPTAQIAALAAACAAWLPHREAYAAHMRAVKDRFLALAEERLSGAVVLSRGDAPHICALSLPGYPSEMLVRELGDRGICVSSGSACHRGKPSHVFAATGRPKRELMGALRVSFSPDSTAEEAEALVSALEEIRRARILRGGEPVFGYMRQGPGFYRNVLSLAVPIILQNLITTSLGLADTLMVGALGEAPLAAVTLANIPVFVMQLLVFGLQSGSSVLISQYWGKGDRESINRVIGVGCYVAGAVSLLFALLMSGFPRQLMGLLTSDPALADIAAQYARIVGPSYIFNSLTSVYVGAHRSMENPRLGMIVFGISMCTNVFLNWVFIFGNLGAPRLEVAGAAIATLTSRVVELAAVAVYAARTPRFRLRPALVLRPGLELVGKFARYSAPVVLNETAWGLGTSLYKVVMGHMEGSVEILAARALAGNIEDVCTVIVFAVSGTTAIVVGREIGSGRDREGVYRVGKVMDTLALLCGLGIGILLLLASRLLLPQYVYPYFQLSQASADIATMMVTFTAVLLALRSFNSTNTVGVLRGGGDVRAALLIDNIPLWCVSLPLAALFGLVLKWGIFWVYIGIAMEQIVKFGAGVRRFRSWKWINDVTAPSRAQAAV